MLEHNVLLTQLHPVRAAISQEHHANRHLGGQAERVRGVCPGRLKARLVATLQGRRNVIDPRCERTKPGINTREVVQATGDFADDAGTRLFPGLTERPISATMMRTKSAAMHQGP